MTLKHWLQQNPFSLALSSGFFGFYAHVGFAKALYENDCYPQQFSGSSAGAIVAGGLASGLSPQELEKIIVSFDRKDFWDPQLGFGYLKGKLFEELLNQHFCSDFERLKFPLHISIFNIRKCKTEIARTGSVAKAIRASGAVPLMFHPTKINSQSYWDGGIFDKTGTLGLASDLPILCHYLLPKGRLAKIEYQHNLRKASPQTKIVALKSLTSCGPLQMKLGPQLVEEAYQKTLVVLNEEVNAGRL